MRKNFGPKPWIFPEPVLIIGTYDEDGVPCAMNAAWGGIDDTEQINMCLSHTHKTVKNIMRQHAFTVSMGTVPQLVACDYVGVVSGNKTTDKVERAGFTVTPSNTVNAPIFNELPMTLECELISYDPASGHLKGRIVNISADESILDAEGLIDPAKLQPITFDPVHNVYRSLGPIVGRAFHDGLSLK